MLIEVRCLKAKEEELESILEAIVNQEFVCSRFQTKVYKIVGESTKLRSLLVILVLLSKYNSNHDYKYF